MQPQCPDRILTGDAAGRLLLALPLLLPEVADSADGCVRRLVTTVAALDGVARAHVVEPDHGAARLCVHFDRDRVSLARIRELVTAAGAGITANVGHRMWRLGGALHPRRAQALTDALRQQPGVLDAGASASGIVRLEYDRARLSDDAARAALLRLGGEGLTLLAPVAGWSAAAAPHGHAHHAHAHHAHQGGRVWLAELPFAIATGVCLAVGFAVARLLPDMPALALVAYALAYGFGGWFTLLDVLAGLRLRRLEIDSLMLVAALGAAILGAWAEGALLLFLFSLGHSLEHGAMRRAQSAISALAELVPPTATVRREGELQTIAAADLRPGDILVVRPHERIAADGFLLRGQGSVDQSALTGESLPADKTAVADAAQARANPAQIAPSAQIFAGSFNGSSALEVEVTRAGGQSMLARVVQLIAESETEPSASERFSTQVERLFVPAVFALAALLLFAGLVVDEPFSASFYRAMAVLVAASPCALAISTPSAVLSGVARAARGGVLVKGGGPLEKLARARQIAFDKTGTLTTGRPRLRSVVAAPGVSETEVLRLAVALEQLSDHPLAAAIVRDGLARLPAGAALPDVSDFYSEPGQGLRGHIEGVAVRIGRLAADDLPALSAHAADMRGRGETVAAVWRGADVVGLMGLRDEPRADAAAAIRGLRGMGIGRMVMLSGDSQTVASAIAADLGLDAAHGDLLPHAKVELLRAMRARGAVAMVGDGVNDAPALASASVGIAMGAAGSDIALETADIALLGDRLEGLQFAVALSRRVEAIIRQNIGISLAIVAILVPATIFGLRIGPAVVAHEGATLLVVLNALRLLGMRLPVGGAHRQ